MGFLYTLVGLGAAISLIASVRRSAPSRWQAGVSWASFGLPDDVDPGLGRALLPAGRGHRGLPRHRQPRRAISSS